MRDKGAVRESTSKRRYNHEHYSKKRNQMTGHNTDMARDQFKELTTLWNCASVVSLMAPAACLIHFYCMLEGRKQQQQTQNQSNKQTIKQHNKQTHKQTNQQAQARDNKLLLTEAGISFMRLRISC
jgi:hypothetical protein